MICVDYVSHRQGRAGSSFMFHVENEILCMYFIHSVIKFKTHFFFWEKEKTEVDKSLGISNLWNFQPQLSFFFNIQRGNV